MKKCSNSICSKLLKEHKCSSSLDPFHARVLLLNLKFEAHWTISCYNFHQHLLCKIVVVSISSTWWLMVLPINCKDHTSISLTDGALFIGLVILHISLFPTHQDAWTTVESENYVISTVHGSLNAKLWAEKKEHQKVSSSVLTYLPRCEILQLPPLLTEDQFL